MVGAVGVLAVLAQVQVPAVFQAEEVLLDLNKLPAGALQRVFVPGERAFNAFFEGHAGGARYRVTSRYALGGGSTSFIEIGKGPADLPTAAECTALFTAFRSFLDATDEAESARMRSNVESALGASRCERAAYLRRWLNSETRPIAAYSGGLEVGDEITVTLERFAAGTDQVARTWKILLVAASPPAQSWTYANEATWLAAEVARETARIAAAAGGVQVPSKVEAQRISARPAYVRIGLWDRGSTSAKNREINTAESIFSPRSYRGFALERLGSVGSHARPSADSTRLIEQLTEPLTSVIAREDGRLFDEIASSPW